jgi:tetratricopeptide (TPR) repeat protein
VTIKGTLETFNLLDLLQMLAFNQKVGTLVLETARGPRTIFVEAGAIGFVRGDAEASRMLARALRRSSGIPPERLERGLSIVANSGKFLGDALVALGALDEEALSPAWIETVEESFFDLIQTPLARFEFVEGKRLAPSGAEGEPILPMRPVDGLLLDLTRKIDEWGVLREEVPDEEEVYEGVEVEGEIGYAEHVPDFVPERVLPLLDGRRTVSQLTAESDCDRFHVVKLLALLVRAGAARRAPTEALLERAEDLLANDRPQDAATLFRRALDREECPPAVRLRLSSALEAAGDPRSAAAEIDVYVAAVIDRHPGEAFDALSRASRLRGGDVASTTRLCDLWIERRTELSDRREAAVESMKRLIAAASAENRHADAADRLARFVEAGAAPSEDLLVLADLYAAADQPRDAADALVRRADALLSAGRHAAAVPMLRRALGYDATRLDARRKLTELEAAARRRRQRRRVGVLATLVTLTLGSAAGVYLVRDGRSTRAVQEVVGHTAKAAEEAEAVLGGALDAWRQAVEATSEGRPPEGGLAASAERLRGGAREAARLLDAALKGARNELEGSGERAVAELDRFAALRRNVDARLDAALLAASTRAEKAVVDGEAAYAQGRFRDARADLQRAIDLSFEDASRQARARQRLEKVAAYEAAFAEAKKPFDAALEAGDHAEAWRLGVLALTTLLDSDLTRELLLPVPVRTDPPGAHLFLADRVFPEATPCVLRYSPLGATRLVVRAPGRLSWEASLPAFADLRPETPPPSLSVALAEGPRWATPLPAEAVGPFPFEDGAVVAAETGRPPQVVRPDGRIGDSRLEATTDRLRLLGTSPVGGWQVLGQRTFSFSPTSAPRWAHATMGRLEQPPAVAEGCVVLADEQGTVTCLEAADGRVRWKRALEAPPAQAPYASSLGFLLATKAGDALALSPKDGSPTVLAPRGRHESRAFPHPSGGALVLGGPDGAAKRVRPDGTIEPVAGAGPAPLLAPHLAPHGIAWVGRDGVPVWLSRSSSVPVRVPGAAPSAVPPVLAEETLYAVDASGGVRAARLADPETTAWRSRAGGAPVAAPVVSGDVLLVRTASAVVGIER